MLWTGLLLCSLIIRTSLYRAVAQLGRRAWWFRSSVLMTMRRTTVNKYSKWDAYIVFVQWGCNKTVMHFFDSLHEKVIKSLIYYLDFAVKHLTLPKLVFVRGYLLRHPCKRRQQENNYVFNFHTRRSHQDLIITSAHSGLSRSPKPTKRKSNYIYINIPFWGPDKSLNQ